MICKNQILKDSSRSQYFPTYETNSYSTKQIIKTLLTIPVRDSSGILLEQNIQQMARPAGDSQKK